MKSDELFCQNGIKQQDGDMLSKSKISHVERGATSRARFVKDMMLFFRVPNTIDDENFGKPIHQSDLCQRPLPFVDNDVQKETDLVWAKHRGEQLLLPQR